jgi:serine/threonine protein kinase
MRSLDVTAIAGNMPAANTSDNQPQVGSLVNGRFLLQQQLPGGSMGVIYKAFDRQLAHAGDANPNVAIKILSPTLSGNAEAMRALQQEVAKGQCLAHQSIVRFIDIDRQDGVYFIIMESLDGISLASSLEESDSQPIDMTVALDIVTQISEALEYAHQRGVVHGDVRPDNIIITPSGAMKLFDFGLARVGQNVLQGTADIDPGEGAGQAPGYCSMQILTGEDPAPADDVFSLGCLLYRLVTGYRVFGPRDAAAAAAAGMVPQQPQGLSEVQWQALKKALAYSRIPRFASPVAFVAALDGLLESGTVSPEPYEPVFVEEYDDEPRRSPWRLAVLGSILLASAAVGLQANMLETLGHLVPMGTFNETSRLPEQSNTPPAPAAELTQTVMHEEPVANTLVEGFIDEVLAEGSAGDSVASGTRPEPEPDFTALLPPTMTVGLATTGQFISEVDLTLREDSEAATIDLVRMNNMLQPYTVLLEEVASSGNRAAWESGQYQVENDGLLIFAAGQHRARTTISMRSDTRREPDRQVTIRVREAGDAGSELARIRLSLEDDDQRAFEAGLPKNTIAFSVSQMSVREFDPVVQIDVLRFQADQTAVVVRYIVRDVTATAGKDYFPPGSTIINFAQGQRFARILIPLVQDTVAESDEVFELELVNTAPQADPDIYQRIAVIIRDDDY